MSRRFTPSLVYGQRAAPFASVMPTATEALPPQPQMFQQPPTEWCPTQPNQPWQPNQQWQPVGGEYASPGHFVQPAPSAPGMVNGYAPQYDGSHTAAPTTHHEQPPEEPFSLQSTINARRAVGSADALGRPVGSSASSPAQQYAGSCETPAAHQSHPGGAQGWQGGRSHRASPQQQASSRPFVFTQQSPVLQEVAAARGFTSNVWAIYSPYYSPLTLRPGEAPTQMTITRGHVYINASTFPPERLALLRDVTTPHNIETMAPFPSDAVTQRLDTIAKARDITNWWCPYEAFCRMRKRGLHVDTVQCLAVKVPQDRQGQVCNLDQLDDDSRLELSTRPIVAQHGTQSARLRVAPSTSPPVLFTEADLVRFGLELRTDAVPADVTVPLSVVPTSVFSNEASLLQTLDVDTHPTDGHRHLPTGQLLQIHPTGPEPQWWVPHVAAVKQQVIVRGRVVSVAVRPDITVEEQRRTSDVPLTAPLYKAEMMTDVDKAYRAVGSVSEDPLANVSHGSGESSSDL